MEATGTNLQTLDLPSTTAAERAAHAEMMLNLQAKKIANTMDVPTLPHHVQNALRNIGQPIRLFGENHANIRDRLRLCLAKIEVTKQQQGLAGDLADEALNEGITLHEEDKAKKGVKVEVQYTHASDELIQARDFMAKYSFEKARLRLQREKKRKWGGMKRILSKHVSNSNRHLGKYYNEQEVLQELDALDESCIDRYNHMKQIALEGSQYGDNRPLSAIAVARQPYETSKDPCLIATGGWSGSIKLWDGSSSALTLLSSKPLAHEDRIMSIAMHKGRENNIPGDENSHVCELATASIDLTGKLWKVKKDEDAVMTEEGTETVTDKAKDNTPKYKIEEMAVLKGHAARLCKVAYHPSGRYVGTTSFDHTWRLWDVETGGKELLLQDGHWKECYGIGFHHDGSLVSTTDFGSIVQVWDLRNGKSACHFMGHAKRVLCTEFSPNGFQLATAGDDGTIKIWDMRQRKQYASIPAHSRLITQLKFGHEGYGQHGEFLTSSSFDGTGKVWSTRNWKLLSTLRGHEGKVMGADVLDGTDAGIVTVGFDKTMKFWR